MCRAKKVVVDFLKTQSFNNVFIIDDITKKQYTYDKFFEICICVAERIKLIDKDKRIVAILDNSFELAMLYFAIMLTDKSIIVIDPLKGECEQGEILSEIENAYIINKENMALFEECGIRKQNGDIKTITCELIEQRDFGSAFIITYTSGTSGKTKGVINSLSNLILTAEALDKKVEKSENSRIIHVMPMTYMAGILNSLFYPFIIGASIVITERFSIASARYFWKIVCKYNVNLFWLSPSMLRMIDQLDRGTSGEDYCKGNKLVFLVGTAPLPHELRERFNNRYGVSVYASYGLSETLFISVENNRSLQNSNINCVGEILDGVEYRLSEECEMYISVPWMFLGYSNVDTEEYFAEEYYKTGDIVLVENKCLYITGRSKDLIIRGGMNISPSLIEQIVSENPKIDESVVVGVKGSDGEEKICCVYTTQENGQKSKELEMEIRRLVLTKLGKNYTIDYFSNLETIPRNINGKIDKIEIKRMLGECDVQ